MNSKYWLKDCNALLGSEGPNSETFRIIRMQKAFSLGRYTPSYDSLQTVQVNIVENLYSVGIT